jgi:hypothetical protein
MNMNMNQYVNTSNENLPITQHWQFSQTSLPNAKMATKNGFPQTFDKDSIARDMLRAQRKRGSSQDGRDDFDSERDSQDVGFPTRIDPTNGECNHGTPAKRRKCFRASTVNNITNSPPAPFSHWGKHSR